MVIRRLLEKCYEGKKGFEEEIDKGLSVLVCVLVTISYSVPTFADEVDSSERASETTATQEETQGTDSSAPDEKKAESSASEASRAEESDESDAGEEDGISLQSVARDWNNYSKIANLIDSTIRGVDLSLYEKSVEWKKQYTNYKQKDVKLMSFLKSQDVNSVTVKVAVNPSTDDQEKKNICTLDNGIKTLKEAKAAGMKTNMVLLYLDWLTSKSDQSVSENFSGESNAAAITYTEEVLAKS